MEEILSILEQIKSNIPGDDSKRIKIELIKSLTVASEDVAKLIKIQDFEGVESRIKKLFDEQMEIRANWVVNQFPSGGIVIKNKNDE